MSAPSAIIVGVLFALVGLAVWRNIRKGAPCSCGGCDACRNGCHCHGEKDPSGEGASHAE